MLEIDGERNADSTDILCRLDQLYPNPPLLSSDPKVAEAQRQLEDWADESFLWYFLAFIRRPGRGPASAGANGIGWAGENHAFFRNATFNKK